MAEQTPPVITDGGTPEMVCRRFRRTRKTARVLAIILAALAVLYLVVYAMGVSAFKKRVNTNVAASLNITDAFHYSGSIWPLGLALRAGELTFDTGKVAGAAIIVPVFTPWHIHSQLDALRMETPDWLLTAPTVRAELILTLSSLAYRATLQDVQLGKPTALNEETLRAPQISIGYERRLRDHNASQPEEATTLQIAPLLLPKSAGPFPDVQPQIDSLNWRITAEPAFPPVMNNTIDMQTRRAMLVSWQQAGGTISVSPLTVDAFGMTANVAGAVQLDQTLALNGKLTLTLSRLAQAYEALGGYNARFHMMPDDRFKTLGTVLRLLPGNAEKDFSFPIGIKNHWLTFLGAPLYRFGPARWEGVPELEKPAETPAIPPVFPAE